LSHGKTFLRTESIDLALDIKERIDTPHRFHGQRRDDGRIFADGLALCGSGNISKLEEVAPRMG
jgi:hypothetical protein